MSSQVVKRLRTAHDSVKVFLALVNHLLTGRTRMLTHLKFLLGRMVQRLHGRGAPSSYMWT